MRVLLFLLLVTTALTVPASPASAHAAPVGSSPAPGSVIGSSPSEVTVTFSEPVAPVTGQVQVIAPDGERISGTATVSGTVVRIPVRKAERPLGTYLISFRVISADSHPVGGAITFSVGAPSARPEAPAASTGPHASVAVAVPIFKTLGYAGITLIAGPALFLAFLWPRRRSRSGALLTIRIGVILTAVATAGTFGSQAQQGSGAALWQVSASELAEVASSRFGLLLLARLAILAALAALLPGLLRAHNGPAGPGGLRGSADPAGPTQRRGPVGPSSTEVPSGPADPSGIAASSRPVGSSSIAASSRPVGPSIAASSVPVGPSGNADPGGSTDRGHATALPVSAHHTGSTTLALVGAAARGATPASNRRTPNGVSADGSTAVAGSAFKPDSVHTESSALVADSALGTDAALGTDNRSAPGSGAAGRTAARVRGWVVLALAVAGLATWPLTGHAVAVPLPAVTVAAAVVHMAAMAVWLGGLVTLSVFLLRGTDRRVLGVILPVWSRWAALSVLWLVVAGLVHAVVQVGRVSALWDTDYGRLLVAKVGILAAVLAVAAAARRLVIRKAAGSGLRRIVCVEVAATAVVLALSSLLVQVDPGRVQAAKEKSISGVGKSETLTTDLYTVQFNIYPVELGEYNTVHAFLYSPAGAPLRAEEWQLTARLLDPPLEAAPQPIAGLETGNQALGSLSFPLAGTYELTFTIRTTEIDRATVKTTVEVGP